LLNRINPAQLEIIRYKFFEKLTYEEFAVRMELQPGTVYNQVYEALKTMRSHLKVLFTLILVYAVWSIIPMWIHDVFYLYPIRNAYYKRV
jgi:hypothetical protein